MYFSPLISYLINKVFFFLRALKLILFLNKKENKQKKTIKIIQTLLNGKEFENIVECKKNSLKEVKEKNGTQNDKFKWTFIKCDRKRKK